MENLSAGLTLVVYRYVTKLNGGGGGGGMTTKMMIIKIQHLLIDFTPIIWKSSTCLPVEKRSIATLINIDELDCIPCVI
jgi:hypothetical protein